MKIFAMDLGNKQTKLYSENTNVVLPSYFMDYEDLGDHSTSIFSSKLDLYKFSVPFDDFEYAWGKDLHKVHAENQFLDTINFDFRYEMPEFKLLANFALGLLAKNEVDNEDNIVEAVVVTGVPSDDFKEEKVKSIIKVLKGDHTVEIDEVSYIIRVQNVHVIPQSAGTIYNELLDEDGNLKNDQEHYMEELVNVVDIGGGTVLIDTFRNLNLSQKDQHQTGIHSLYDDIVARAKFKNVKNESITPYDVEMILRQGNEESGYYYKPNKNESIDITDIVVHSIKKYTRNLLNKVTSSIKSSAVIDTILVSGGGSQIIFKEPFESRYPYVIFVKDGELANVKGFYKYGKALLNK